MGPNTGLGHNSMIFMIEAQARYAVQALEAMRARAARVHRRAPEVEAKFRSELAREDEGHRVDDRLPELVPDARTARCSCGPSATVDYWWRTRTVALSDYEIRALATSRGARSAA